MKRHSKNARKKLAYLAMERDTLSDDDALAARADDAMDRMFSGLLTPYDWTYWAEREIEWQSLND